MEIDLRKFNKNERKNKRNFYKKILNTHSEEESLKRFYNSTFGLNIKSLNSNLMEFFKENNAEFNFEDAENFYRLKSPVGITFSAYYKKEEVLNKILSKFLKNYLSWKYKINFIKNNKDSKFIKEHLTPYQWAQKKQKFLKRFKAIKFFMKKYGIPPVYRIDGRDWEDQKLNSIKEAIKTDIKNLPYELKATYPDLKDMDAQDEHCYYSYSSPYDIRKYEKISFLETRRKDNEKNLFSLMEELAENLSDYKNNGDYYFDMYEDESLAGAILNKGNYLKKKLFELEQQNRLLEKLTGKSCEPNKECLGKVFCLLKEVQSLKPKLLEETERYDDDDDC